MSVSRRKKIVLLGMMTKIPVAGAVWGTLHYLLGFQRLGFEPYYIECHARTPSMFMQTASDDSAALAAGFIEQVMKQFDLQHNWSFHALHDDGRYYGMNESQVKQLYLEADAIINYHGGTVPIPEHYQTNRLVYLETDPVETEIELANGDANTLEFLKPHCAFYTWGLNYYRPDCQVPMHDQIPFKIMPPAVVCDLWEPFAQRGGRALTTIGNWRQPWRDVVFRGEVYHWSKHFEFMKFIDLPRHTDQPFELGLASYEPQDQQMLESHGWQITPAVDFSWDLGKYRDYIGHSRGEFTVAKDQNIRLRSGWFSERSAQYLAAGKPVITQETGFSNVLPTGEGLFGFSSSEEILAAVSQFNADYDRHRRGAAKLARELFNYDVVLPMIIDDLDL